MVPRKYVNPGSKLYLNPITKELHHTRLNTDYSEFIILINPISKVETYMENDCDLLGRQMWEVVENELEIKDMIIHFNIGSHAHYYRRYNKEKPEIQRQTVSEEFFEDKFCEVIINGKKIEVY